MGSRRRHRHQVRPVLRPASPYSQRGIGRALVARQRGRPAASGESGSRSNAWYRMRVCGCCGVWSAVRRSALNSTCRRGAREPLDAVRDRAPCRRGCNGHGRPFPSPAGPRPGGPPQALGHAATPEVTVRAAGRNVTVTAGQWPGLPRSGPTRPTIPASFFISVRSLRTSSSTTTTSSVST